jgi:nucleoside-diphosphate-sugar epimerase
MTRRVFLTGHRGYLGKCLAYLIKQDAHLSLITTDERLETLKKSSIACDVVIHTVCRRSNARGDNQHELKRDNEDSTHALIAALQSPTPIIYTSSVWVYDSSQVMADEKVPPTSYSAYGVSKRNTELLLTESQHTASILRLGTLWGFGFDRYGRTFLDDCIGKVKAQQPITLLEEPAWRAPLFVWDAARWIYTMVKQSLYTPILIMAGENVVLQEKIERLCAHAPETYSPIIIRKPGKVESPRSLLDTRLWQTLCKNNHFRLTPWPVLERRAWQEGSSPWH